MMLLPTPKFIGNSADGNHCGPAVWRMVLETYFPERVWTFDEIDKIIRKEPGKYTWAQTFMPAMLETGVRIRAISTWDDRQFIERDWDYVRERSGAASARAQEEHAQDLGFVKSAMQAFINNPDVQREQRPATWGDLEAALAEGAYAACAINSRPLNGRDGVNMHSVLVYGLSGDEVRFQDPGPLNAGTRAATRDLFAAAWGWNGPGVQNLTAFYRPA